MSCNLPVMFMQSILCCFIIIGCDDKHSIYPKIIHFFHKRNGPLRRITSYTCNDRNSVIGLCYHCFDYCKTLILRHRCRFSSRATYNNRIRFIGNLSFHQVLQHFKINALIFMKWSHQGDSGATKHRHFFLLYSFKSGFSRIISAISSLSSI